MIELLRVRNARPNNPRRSELAQLVPEIGGFTTERRSKSSVVSWIQH